MRRVIVLVCLIIALSDCENAVDSDALQDRGGIKYLPNSETPFAGNLKIIMRTGN